MTALLPPHIFAVGYTTYWTQDFAPEKDMAQELSNLYSELAHNFTVDTGLKVGPFIHGLDGGDE